MKELVAYRDQQIAAGGAAPPKILALGLSSRKNLCIHPRVSGAPRAPPWAGLDLGWALSYAALPARNQTL